MNKISEILAIVKKFDKLNTSNFTETTRIQEIKGEQYTLTECKFYITVLYSLRSGLLNKVLYDITERMGKNSSEIIPTFKEKTLCIKITFGLPDFATETNTQKDENGVNN